MEPDFASSDLPLTEGIAAELALHHVAVMVTDLDRSVAFYQKMFGLGRLERPPFRTEGAWLAAGPLQVHLIVYPPGTFRQVSAVDTNDLHFAFRTGDFDAALAHLLAQGFSEQVAQDDPRHIVVLRESLAGFPQLYIQDPDRNIIEINGAPN